MGEASRIQIKICGVRTPEGLDACVRSSVDLIGFNFAPTSRRAIAPRDAAALLARLPGEPPFEVVGVFSDPDLREIEAVLEVVTLDCVQLHGNEPSSFVSRLEGTGRVSVMKAITVGEDIGLALDLAESHRRASARILFDGSRPGTGTSFDWSLLGEHQVPYPFFLAGGLHEGNVAQAIAACRPAGVDTASGVEVEGVQDPARIEAFCAAVRSLT